MNVLFFLTLLHKYIKQSSIKERKVEWILLLNLIFFSLPRTIRLSNFEKVDTVEANILKVRIHFEILSECFSHQD
jgi:putative effector of murein hydrolase LrgA (UPF0299 family)